MPLRARRWAPVLLTGLLLAGCGTGPGEPGAAAIVGSARIPVSQVQDRLDEVLRDPEEAARLREEGGLGNRGRQLASFLVQQELIEQAAVREGLRVPESRVDAALQEQGGPAAVADGTLVTPPHVRDYVRSSLLLTELGRAQAGRLSVLVDYLGAGTRGQAQQLAGRIAAGDTAALDEAQRAGRPVARGERLSVAGNPELAALTPMFGAQPGTVLAFEPQPNSGQWIVARIAERSVAPGAPDPAAAQLDEQTLQAIGLRLLGATAQQVGVELSPRYGVWDPIALNAAPEAGQTTGFSFPPRAADRG
ncbi:hypothetical protein IQ251_05465 [Saccharopolyspora sp. HNM0983]|uniref:SurA-like protein n=1 Tax=Saccharopolyspora montiporae TaxID=2781240 RepID=A0A929B657_9PSEU|nr:hypothetical protein [Saccharopolyspora sp. HNM0983]